MARGDPSPADDYGLMLEDAVAAHGDDVDIYKGDDRVILDPVRGEERPGDRGALEDEGRTPTSVHRGGVAVRHLGARPVSDRGYEGDSDPP